MAIDIQVFYLPPTIQKNMGNERTFLYLSHTIIKNGQERYMCFVQNNYQ